MMFLSIPLYRLPSFLYTFLFHFHAFIFDDHLLYHMLLPAVLPYDP